MHHNRLATLALAGLLTAGVSATSLAAAEGGDGKASGGAAAENDCKGKNDCKGMGDSKAKSGKDGQYHKVHACAGKNVCKGLGGCKVTEQKLEKLAEKRGIPVAKAGEAHGCAGKNACKGLGGCKVTAEKFTKLKAAKEAEEGAGASK